MDRVIDYLPDMKHYGIDLDTCDSHIPFEIFFVNDDSIVTRDSFVNTFRISKMYKRISKVQNIISEAKNDLENVQRYINHLHEIMFDYSDISISKTKVAKMLKKADYSFALFESQNQDIVNKIYDLTRPEVIIVNLIFDTLRERRFDYIKKTWISDLSSISWCKGGILTVYYPLLYVLMYYEKNIYDFMPDIVLSLLRGEKFIEKIIYPMWKQIVKISK